MTAEQGLAEASRCLLEGDAGRARACCLEILEQAPACAAGLRLLGLAEAGDGRIENAISTLQRAAALDAEPDSWSDLGSLHTAREQWRPAAQCFRRAMRLGQRDGYVRIWRARALAESGSRAQAKRLLARLELQQAPDDCLYDLAAAHRAAWNPKAELQSLLRCVEQDPAHGAAHQRLAEAYLSRMEYEAAVRHAEQALQLYPDNCEVLSLLGHACWGAGQAARAASCFAECAERSGDPNAYSTLLYTQLFDPAHTARSLRRTYEGWAARFCPRNGPPPGHPHRSPETRRLRLGFLSGEFTAAPSFYFLYPFLAAHDRRRFELFFYHTRPYSDRATAAYRGLAHRWKNVSGWQSSRITEKIRRDEVDILIDFSGHFPDHALGVFAMRPAPVSATYPIYPSTTGVSGVDYLLTDRWIVPPGDEDGFVESPLRLPRGIFAYMPPACAPPVGVAPVLGRGAITFGLFQQPVKTNPGVWDAVAGVLRAVPDSRLLVHYGSRDLDVKGSQARRSVQDALQLRGVSPDRLAFTGCRRLPRHLAALAQADIALDTFPFNGHTTTCECLWMGVPVVSMAGETASSRVGLSLLTAAGLQGWVARSPEQYVAIASQKASRIAALARLRSSLRARMAASSLLDGKGLARALEQSYRRIRAAV